MPKLEPQGLSRSALKHIRISGLDLAERVFLVVTLGWFLLRMAPSLGRSLPDTMIVASESFVVLMVMIRAPGPISLQPLAWATAVIGTFAPLLVIPNGPALMASVPAGVLMLAGLLISVSAKLFLNRSFGIVAGNRGVKTQGPYRYIRHPMYFGYALTHSGFLMSHLSWWNAALYAATWTAIAIRIALEEAFLNRDPDYRAYACAVPYRMLPGIF